MDDASAAMESQVTNLRLLAWVVLAVVAPAAAVVVVLVYIEIGLGGFGEYVGRMRERVFAGSLQFVLRPTANARARFLSSFRKTIIDFDQEPISSMYIPFLT